MTAKRFTYLNASKNKYIGSFFCNNIPLTNDEVINYLNELVEYKNNINRILQAYYDMSKEIDTDCQLVVLDMIKCITEEMGVELKDD